jgi:hypothetical protein
MSSGASTEEGTETEEDCFDKIHRPNHEGCTPIASGVLVLQVFLTSYLRVDSAGAGTTACGVPANGATTVPTINHITTGYINQSSGFARELRRLESAFQLLHSLVSIRRNRLDVKC